VPDEIYPAVTVAAPLTGPPAACSWGPERIDVFARGSSGDVLHKWWDGKAWSPFVSLGMPVTADAEPAPLPSTGAIAACSWGVDRLDVFTLAVDGNLYHACWDGSWDHDRGYSPKGFGGPGTLNGLSFSHTPLNEINPEIQNGRYW